MCSPAIASVIQVAGTAQSAIASVNAGKAQQSYYNYLATQNEVQAQQVAKTANQNVGIVAGAEGVAETNLNRQVSTIEGTQKASLAASGVYSGGSAEAVQRDTENKANLDKEAIKQNAFLQSQQIATASTNQQQALRTQAGSFTAAGQDARSAGNINAFTSVLNGATQVASSWYDYSRTSRGNNPRSAIVNGKTVPVAPPNYYKWGF